MILSCLRQAKGWVLTVSVPCSWPWGCTWWRWPWCVSPPFSCLLPQGFPRWGPSVTCQLIFWAVPSSHIHQTWDRCPLWEAWGHLQGTGEHLEGLAAEISRGDRQTSKQGEAGNQITSASLISWQMMPLYLFWDSGPNLWSREMLSVEGAMDGQTNGLSNSKELSRVKEKKL